VGRFGMAMFAVFFAAHIWRHANQVLLLGFDQEKWVARVIVIEAACVFAVFWFMLHAHTHLDFVYAGVATTIAVVTGWAFPKRFRTLLHEVDTEDSIESHESTGLDQRTTPV